jgi:hypothetical protein
MTTSGEHDERRPARAALRWLAQSEQFHSRVLEVTTSSRPPVQGLTTSQRQFRSVVVSDQSDHRFRLNVWTAAVDSGGLNGRNRLAYPLSDGRAGRHLRCGGIWSGAARIRGGWRFVGWWLTSAHQSAFQLEPVCIVNEVLFRGGRYSESRISREGRRDDLVGIIVA